MKNLSPLTKTGIGMLATAAMILAGAPVVFAVFGDGGVLQGASAHLMAFGGVMVGWLVFAGLTCIGLAIHLSEPTQPEYRRYLGRPGCVGPTDGE